jgi:transposase
MRGNQSNQQEDMFSYVSMESAIPSSHPIRKIRELVDPIFKNLSPEFDKIYSSTGRPSIPPEQLLKALLIQVLFTIRSERQLIEQLNYNLLYRWFVGLGMSGTVWDQSTFVKNRDRLLEGEIAEKFFREVVIFAEKKKLISKEHFSVDGSIVHAWASLKSFQEKEKHKSKDDDKQDPDDRNPSVDFKGEKRTNDTHESKTDPEAKIFTKSKGEAAKLSYMGHAMTENRNGLVIDARLTEPGYYEEPTAALEMAMGLDGEQRKTLGADKHYDQSYLCDSLRAMGIAPHIAQNIHSKKHSSAIDGRTTRHKGYDVSQRKRKRIEEVFGWLKTIGLMRRPMFRGKKKMEFAWIFALSCYNLVRIKNLCAA